MKLGVVTTSYPRFAGDPAGNFVAAHVAALRAAGHQVEVIAAGDRRPAASRTTSDAHRTGASEDAHRSAAPRFDRGDPAGDALGVARRRFGRARTDAPGDAHRSAAPRFDRGDPADEAVRIASRLFYRGGAPDALERAPLGSALAAAAFTARLTAAVAARAGRWDAIVAHWLVPSALAALPAGRPLTAIGHGGDVFTLRRLGLLRPALHALARRRAHLVLVSEQLREVARAAAPELAGWLDAAVIQPMGVDVARFAALARAPSDPPIVLCAARLVPIKGVDVAIAAMPHVRAPARLLVAGDGPERAQLAARAAAATLIARMVARNAPQRAWLTDAATDEVTDEAADEVTGEARRMLAGDARARFAAPPTAQLLGQITTDRRDELLRIASVVVVPSRVVSSRTTPPRICWSRTTRPGRTEGTPAIALEALAAGVPVVASAVGGLRDLGRLPGVRLVPPDDPRALAAAIDQAIADPPPAAALRAAVADFDWRAVAPRLLLPATHA